MICITFLAVISTVSATNLESVRVTVSQAGLDFAEGVSEILFDVIKDEAPARLSIPDMSGDKFKLRNMKLKSLVLKKPVIAPVKGTGISSTNPARVHVSGDWSVKAGWWWVHGSLDLSSDMSVSTITAVSESNGYFSTRSAGCSVDFQTFDLDLHNGFVSWVAGLVKGTIKTEIKNAVCKEVNAVLRSTVKDILASLPQQISIGELFDVHIRADSGPSFGSDQISIPGRVSITSQGSRPNFPFSPEPMVSNMDNSYMACLLVSDYTVNTGTYSSISAGTIDYDVPNSDIDASNPIFNTAHFQNSLPELYSSYPDMPLSLTIVNTRFPLVEFDFDEVMVNMPVDIDVQVSGQTVLSLSVNLTVNAALEDDNGVISGEFVSSSHTTDLLDTSLPGTITSERMSGVVDDVLSQTLFPELNAVLRQGFPLPGHSYININKVLLEAHDDFLKVCGDLSITDAGKKALKEIAEDFLD